MKNIIANITDYISQYKLLCVIFVILCVITAIVCAKAGQAVKRTNARKDELLKELDRLKKIREKYSDIDEEGIRNDSGELLAEGLVLNMQASLEKAEDMNAAFEDMTECRKKLYAVNYFLEDGAEKASDFFKAYGRPITPYAAEAVKDIFGKEAGEAVGYIFDAYDSENDEVSLVPEKIDEFDEKVKRILESVDCGEKVTCYIKDNASVFATK